MCKKRWKQKLAAIIAGVLAVGTANAFDLVDVDAASPNDIYLEQMQTNEASGTSEDDLQWTLDAKGISSITGAGEISPSPIPAASTVSSKISQKLKAKYDSGSRQLQRTVGDKIVQRIRGAQTKVVYTSSNKGVAKITKVNCERGNWCEITCVGAGRTVITAKARADSEYKAASKSFTLYVSPQAAKVVSLQSDKAGQVTIKSNNAAKGSDGYQIIYRHNGKVKKIQVKGRKPLTKTIKNLRSGKNFRVKIRTYKERKGEIFYGKYSAWKTLDKVK